MARKVRIVLEIEETEFPAGIYSTDKNLADDAIAWLEHNPKEISNMVADHEVIDDGE